MKSEREAKGEDTEPCRPCYRVEIYSDYNGESLKGCLKGSDML